jgi:hypothetical protein
MLWIISTHTPQPASQPPSQSTSTHLPSLSRRAWLRQWSTTAAALGPRSLPGWGQSACTSRTCSVCGLVVKQRMGESV